MGPRTSGRNPGGKIAGDSGMGEVGSGGPLVSSGRRGGRRRREGSVAQGLKVELMYMVAHHSIGRGTKGKGKKAAVIR